jgi:hypothetical protein
MDSILKKAFQKEVQDVFDRIEDIVEKYSSTGVVYSLAVGFVEDETEEAKKWNLAYGWNCIDEEEFAEFMTLQLEAYSQEDEANQWFSGLSLN